MNSVATKFLKDVLKLRFKLSECNNFRLQTLILEVTTKKYDFNGTY